MIHMPSAITGKSWKLAQPFHRPFRILSVTPTNVEARLVDDPDAKSILILWQLTAFSPVLPAYLTLHGLELPRDESQEKRNSNRD